MKTIVRSCFCFFTLLLFSTSFSYAADPQCMDNAGHALPVMNAQVLTWQQTEPTNFHARALVQGTIVKRYADNTGHAHFAIDLDGNGTGDLEVIYQYDFGQLPNLAPGMKVTACGDYITDHRGSPNGGIIHWVHCNPGTRDGGLHPHGFVDVNGQVFGYTPTEGSCPVLSGLY
jgi:hypothetical protein